VGDLPFGKGVFQGGNHEFLARELIKNLGAQF
jgi:hypothetical protein